MSKKMSTFPEFAGKQHSTIKVARFFLVQHTKTGGGYTKRPQTTPNDLKLYQMITNYM
jgi:hypothetical protein